MPAVVILVIAVPVYAAMLWHARALTGIPGDAEGLTALLAAGALALLWLLLAGLLLLGGARGWMPRWAAIAWCVVLPVSGGGAFHMLGAIGSAAPWAIACLAALPVLIAVYAFWAHLPILHPTLPPVATSAIALLAVLGVAFAPVIPAGDAAPAKQAEAPPAPSPAADAGPAKPAPPADIEARLALLGPDSPLADFLPFLASGGDLKRRALERARLLTNRQTDAVALLRRGELRGLEDLWRLDVMPTADLCAAFGDQLGAEAGRQRGKAGYWAVADNLEIHLETMNWLVSSGCNLNPALAAMAATAASYPQATERDRFLAAIDALMSPDKDAAQVDPAQCIGATDAAPEQQVAACTAIVRTGRAGQGRLAAALVTRGNGFYALRSYDRAIADYAAALRLSPPDTPASARLLSNRANAYDAKGDHDAALRDYDDAIRLDPNFAMAFNNRGAFAAARGQHDRAVADFDQALRLDPTYATAFANRGRSRFFQGDYPAAAQDFEQARARRPSDAYVLLWRSLAQQRAGQKPVIAADAAGLDRTAWPWPLVAVFMGDHDAAWGAEAAASGTPELQARRACEAAFYLGEKMLGEGNAVMARTSLSQAASGCPPRAIEGASARSELARPAR